MSGDEDDNVVNLDEHRDGPDDALRCECGSEWFNLIWPTQDEPFRQGALAFTKELKPRAYGGSPCCISCRKVPTP